MNDWQDISTAPHGKAVWCYWSGPMFLSDDWRQHAAKFAPEYGAWVDPETDTEFATAPTHWMPLPAPPKAGP